MSFATNNTGGEYRHTLVANELPNHEHGLIWNWDNAPDKGSWHWYGVMQGGVCYETGNWTQNNSWRNELSPEITCKDQPHNNVSPYIVVSFWRRTN